MYIYSVCVCPCMNMHVNCAVKVVSTSLIYLQVITSLHYHLVMFVRKSVLFLCFLTHTHITTITQKDYDPYHYYTM